MPFFMPPDFIRSAGVSLTEAEIAYGVDRGWLEPKGAVVLAADELSRNSGASARVFELASVMKDEMYLVVDIIIAMRLAAAVGQRPEEVWKYLSVLYLRRNAPTPRDTWGPLVSVSYDFGDPAEMATLIHYMPFRARFAGDVPGPAYIEAAVDRFLAQRAPLFTEPRPARNPQSENAEVF
jgi:hypothetical protein